MLASFVICRVLRLKPRKVWSKGAQKTLFTSVWLTLIALEEVGAHQNGAKAKKDGKIAALLILSANERTNVFPPLTSLITLANMRLVQTIPL